MLTLAEGEKARFKKGDYARIRGYAGGCVFATILRSAEITAKGSMLFWEALDEAEGDGAFAHVDMSLESPDMAHNNVYLGRMSE